MRAVVVTPGRERSARVVDEPVPVRRDGEYLIDVLEVGIDGTDRELHAGAYGDAPEGEDLLVIGHESLGRVAEECPGEACFREGDLVVATVRRPDPRRCLNCRNGAYDFCLRSDYRERGIKGLHGFLAERYTERPEFLVRVPSELREVAVLLEPLSVVEKAIRQAYRIQERIRWKPERAIIAGAGSVGLLALLLARLRGLEALVYSRGPAKGAVAEILAEVGGAYVDSEERTLRDAAAEFGTPDLVVEATGYSPLAWQAAEALRANGIGCLLSVTGGDRKTEIPSDRLNQHLVLGNRLVFGSVSSHRLDFEQGIEDLLASRRRWPGTLERFITRRLPLARVEEALEEKEPEEIKTVVGVAVDVERRSARDP